MRTALRAGPTAATTVTPTPTASPTRTVRGSNTSDPVGSVIPNPRRSASSPNAASTPRPRPIAEETSPTMAASASTERNTWRRLAPTHRSRASSRVRCPTMMEKVLKMVNPPTNREMKAKTRRAVEKNESAWLTELVCSFTTVCPVTTSTPGGRMTADVLLDRGLAGTRGCHHVDVIQVPHLLKDGLRGRQRERGQGRSGEVVRRPELGNAGDGERPGRSGKQHADPLPHGEVVLRPSRCPSPRHRRSPAPPCDEVQGGDLLMGVEARAEGRRATGLDRLAVVGYELGVAPDPALGGLDSGHAADRGQQ